MHSMTRLIFGLAALLCFASCSDNREHRARLVVRGLIKSEDSLVRHHMAQVVALGRFVLPDIEQEYQGASYKGRLRLMTALEHIGDPESLHLLRHIARHDDDRVCRRKAAEVIKALQKAPRPAAK